MGEVIRKVGVAEFKVVKIQGFRLKEGASVPGAWVELQEAIAGNRENLKLRSIGSIAQARGTNRQPPSQSAQGTEALATTLMPCNAVEAATLVGQTHDIEAGDTGGKDQLGILAIEGLTVSRRQNHLPIGLKSLRRGKARG